MTFLWILLGIVYVAFLVFFGLATFRKGHYWLFWIGFFSRSCGSSGPSSHLPNAQPHAPPARCRP